MITEDRIAKRRMDETWNAGRRTDGWTGGRADGPRNTERRTDGRTNERIEKHLRATDMTWCCYCCYAGCGMGGLDVPCCFCFGEICYPGGTVKLTSCWDQDGCCSNMSKYCCSLVGFEFSIYNTPSIGRGRYTIVFEVEGANARRL